MIIFEYVFIYSPLKHVLWVITKVPRRDAFNEYP